MVDSLTLIIVDDEKIIREGLRDMVDWNQLGFSVAECFEDGRDAIEYLSQTSVDVVLTDIKMGDVSGTAVSQYVSDHLPETKVVVLSGYRDFRYAQQAVENQVFRYLVKPVDFPELESAFADLRRRIDDERNLSRSEEEGEERWRELLPSARRQFFADLVSGRIAKPESRSARFEQLDLPFTIDSHPCCLLVITLRGVSPEQIESFYYGVLNALAEIDDSLWYEIRRSDDQLTRISHR